MKFDVSAFARLREPVIHLFIDVLVGQILFELVSKLAPGAKQIADAKYDPPNDQVHVAFHDGTTEQVNL